MQVGDLFKDGITTTYQAGETILRQDDVTMWVYLIKKGLVREYLISQEGVEITVNYHKTGHIFPHTWSMKDKLLAARFEAHKSTELVRISEKEFASSINKFPDFIYGITANVLEREKSVVRRMGCRMFCHAYSRIIDSIIYLATQFGEQEEGNRLVIRERFTHKDIAALAGVTRETASVELGVVSKKGFVQFDERKITIPDLELLRHELDQHKQKK